MDDETRHWLKPLLIGLGSLLAVSVLIGGIVSVVALGAADVAGLAGDETGGPSAKPSLYMPTPTPTPAATPRPAGAGAGAGGGSAEPDAPEPAPSEADKAASDKAARDKAARDKQKQRPRRGINLSASPSSVGAFDRIYLTGSYRGGNGATLQVQRLAGGWADFPTTATVSGGRFTTYVESGRSGRNRFRVVDESTGRTSNAVSVTIR